MCVLLNNNRRPYPWLLVLRVLLPQCVPFTECNTCVGWMLTPLFPLASLIPSLPLPY
jgi:hypothetical protein